MLIGSLVELHAWLHSYLCFSFLEKLFLSNLDTSLTPGYLSSFSTSFYHNLDSFSTTRWIDFQNFWTLYSFSTARWIDRVISWPLDSWWIERASLLMSDELFLDAFSTTASVKAFLLDTFLNTCLDTSRHLYLSSFTDLLYKGSARSFIHFSRSLSQQIQPFTSQTSLTHSKSFPQDFSSFSSLSQLHAFHVLKPRFWGF